METLKSSNLEFRVQNKFKKRMKIVLDADLNWQLNQYVTAFGISQVSCFAKVLVSPDFRPPSHRLRVWITKDGSLHMSIPWVHSVFSTCMNTIPARSMNMQQYILCLIWHLCRFKYQWINKKFSLFFFFLKK